MATIGQMLTAPEPGWKRYDDADENLNYIGSWSKSQNVVRYNGSNAVGLEGALVKIRFTGTKFRLISNYANDRFDSATAVKITIDSTDYYINQYSSMNKDGQYLVFEKVDLSGEEHSIKIEHNGVSGIFTIDAIDIDENGILKPWSTIAAPTNLTATAGDSQVALSWTAVSGATGYNVKRSNTTGGPYTTVGANVSTTSFVDTTVTNGTTYYYVVTALYGTAESANSNEASATSVASSKSLLRVTMNDSSEREYQLSSTEINGFVTWFNRNIGTGTTGYVFNKTAQNSKEYLSFEKIISFEVIPLTK